MSDAVATLRQPFPHQRRAIEQLKMWNGRALLCDEMGLGKSSTALWTLAELYADPVVIVCPLSVVHKWQNEVRETLDKPAVVLSGLTLKQLAQAYLTAAEQNAHLVLHYEAVEKLATSKPFLALSQGERFGLILDESHYVKNRTANRSKAVRELAARARYVLCLTGTPIRNDVRDIWHQVQLARPGHLYDYARFETRYTKQVRFQFPSMKRPVLKFDGAKNEAELATKLHDVMVMRKKCDVFDLPAKVRTVVPLEMGTTERTRYDEMKRSAMVTLQAAQSAPIITDPTFPEAQDRMNGAVIARTALEQVIRLEQLTCGVLGGSNLDKPLQFADAAKIAWTLETIEDLRAQRRSVVVFCKFNATIRLLVTLMNQDEEYMWTLTGDTKPEERQLRIELFRAGKTDAFPFLCQLKLAEGFDLTPSTDAIFLGIDWTPAAMDQAEDRLHRIGTTGTVNCYYPVIERSIDQRLYRTVVEKREDARRVLEMKDVMEELAS